MTEASTLLAIAFPPSDGLRGAMTTVGNIPGWYPNKSYAAHLCFTRNMELGNAYGKGNKAAKREQAIAFDFTISGLAAQLKHSAALEYICKFREDLPIDWNQMLEELNEPHEELTPDDINRMAAIADENRTEAHHYPTIHPND